MKEEVELKKEINPIVLRAQSLEIKTPQDFSGASQNLIEIKSAQKKVKEFFEPMKQRAHLAWKAVIEKEKEVLTPLTIAERSLKTKLILYKREADEKRHAEQQRLQAKAEAEAKRKRDKLLKEAEKLKTEELKESRIEEAESIETPTIAIQSEIPNIKGISTRKIWKADLISKKEFLKRAIEDDNLLGFIDIDLGKLQKIAQATKGMVKYPGVRFYEETRMAAG